MIFVILCCFGAFGAFWSMSGRPLKRFFTNLNFRSRRQKGEDSFDFHEFWTNSIASRQRDLIILENFRAAGNFLR